MKYIFCLCLFLSGCSALNQKILYIEDIDGNVCIRDIGSGSQVQKKGTNVQADVTSMQYSPKIDIKGNGLLSVDKIYIKRIKENVIIETALINLQNIDLGKSMNELYKNDNKPFGKLEITTEVEEHE